MSQNKFIEIKHFNQKQLADRWQVSEPTLERWRTKGIGPVFIKLGGRVIYRLQDVQDYELQRLRESTSKSAQENKNGS